MVAGSYAMHSFSSDVSEMPGSPVPNLAGCAKFAEIWAAGIIADHSRTSKKPARQRRGLGHGHAGVAKLCLLDVLLLSALCVANCKFVSVSDDVTMLIDPMVDSQLLPQR